MPKHKTARHYGSVDASPVKSFFVSMLTRDIRLEEAILDLLDNCVDGILRSGAQKKGTKPYLGFTAEIEFERNLFTISDNCGGIPWNLHDYAFRMGRPKDRPADLDNPGSVGAYGIGMKRAIFKLGKDCVIQTKSGNDEYDVQITADWIDDEGLWDIPVRASTRRMRHDGTTIIVGDLHPGVADRFSVDSKAFEKDLRNLVETHYAFIIAKGFTVTINGRAVTPRPTHLIFDDAAGGKKAGSIQPYIFRTVTEDGVDVFLTVGFTRPIPTAEEIADEQEEKRYSSLEAGWTVICNDRAVLYCDRTELTGWGEANVPSYHTQFIAISGIVEFRATDPSKLPTTTTKRGIDAASRLYLQVKNRMREGMRLFTDYTNKWKGRVSESKKHIEKGKPLSFEEIKERAQALQLRPTTSSGPKGLQYKPTLPLPRQLAPGMRRISFVRRVEDVRCISKYLFNDERAEASLVGEKCFDLILRDAKK